MEENRGKIRKFFSRFYRHHRLADSDDLVQLGLINSLFVAQLSMFLEREFALRLEVPQQIDSLRSIDRICELVEQQQQAESAESSSYRLPNGLVIEHLNKTDTDHFYEDIFVHQTYLSNGIKLQDNDCVFDIGANIGLFSLFALNRNKGVTVYAFEPSPLTFHALSKNMAQYKDRVHLFECGLSDSEGRGTFTHYNYSSGMSTFYPDEAQEASSLQHIIENSTRVENTDREHLVALSVEDRLQHETFNCEIRTLAGILKDYPVSRIDLLKIDAQKAEWNILKGIPDDFWPHIRQIVMEVHDIDSRVSEISGFLRNLRYEVKLEQDPLYQGTNHYNLFAVRR